MENDEDLKAMENDEDLKALVCGQKMSNWERGIVKSSPNLSKIFDELCQ